MGCTLIHMAMKHHAGHGLARLCVLHTAACLHAWA
jgi:hypothetical protein